MDALAYPPFKHSAFTGVIGVSQEDITPPPGIYSGNWGAAQYDFADGVHRPILLTCVTFQSSASGRPLVLIGADLGWWKSAADEWLVRKGILEALSLQPQELMLCLSHTHSGPGIHRGDAAKPGGHLIEPYLYAIRDAAIRAVRTALAASVPATLIWNYGACLLATNRDLPERDRQRIIVGFNPQQPPDDTLLVGRVTDRHHRIIATLVNYACHPTTLAWKNRLISPDYVGAMRELVQSYTQAPSLFLQGASGDLAPAEQYVGDVEVADQHGRQLGYAVLSTLSGMLPPDTQLQCSGVVESGAALAMWEREPGEANGTLLARKVDVPFALKPLPKIAEIEEELRQCEDRVLRERLSRKLAIRKTLGDGDVAYMPLWVWQLGDSILMGQPNEAYSDFQITLRGHFAPRAVAVMNIVNGHVGYLPPEQMYGLDVYSVWQTPFAQGSLEKLIDTATKTAEEIISNHSNLLTPR